MTLCGGTSPRPWRRAASGLRGKAALRRCGCAPRRRSGPAARRQSGPAAQRHSGPAAPPHCDCAARARARGRVSVGGWPATLEFLVVTPPPWCQESHWRCCSFFMMMGASVAFGGRRRSECATRGTAAARRGRVAAHRLCRNAAAHVCGRAACRPWARDRAPGPPGGVSAGRRQPRIGVPASLQCGTPRVRSCGNGAELGWGVAA